MFYYIGEELKNKLPVAYKAICVLGLYSGYEVFKCPHNGDLLWSNGDIVDDTTKEFKQTKWKLVVDQAIDSCYDKEVKENK